MMSLLIWLLFGFVAYKIAKAKGYGGILWVIFGALFGIFALALAIALPADEE